MSGIILVRDIMVRNVKTVRTDDTVLEAVKKMNKFRIGSVIVTNNGRPVGIITERNILQRIVEPSLDPAILRVKDIRKMDEKGIEKQLKELNLELSKEKANIHIGASVTSPGRIREIRKTIARIKTIRKEKK